MRTIENAAGFRLLRFSFWLGLLPVLTWLCGCENVGPARTMSAADCIRAEREHEAAIRAEANAPGPAGQDEQRIASALSARAARDQNELATYAKFKFQQQIALAGASATRFDLSREGSTETAAGNSELHRSTIAVTGHTPRKSGQTTSDSAASDRFYARSMEEGAVNQMVSNAADAPSDTEEAPYGTPVPGRPGYVTSPPNSNSGYIDVRGYQPGTMVIDPYTGRYMRVP